ncbi:MAG: C40 family peptidase [Angelakisella sp.]|nr:C40 family peptidase [Angelakisella sp.]
MKYLVRVPIASLYLRPESPCELADEALCGWSLELLEELPEGWCKVKTHYGYTGFTRRNSLVDTDALVAAWQQRPKAVVTRFTADILDAPKVQGGCVETLTRGAWVSPDGPADKDGWVPVSLCDGRRGYTKKSFLGEVITAWEPAQEEQLREAFVQTALSYMGVQYRWGGRTPLGLDCSGLCSQAYLMNGVLIHRDARIDPAYCMKPIPRERLRRGDLLFFKGHVAMYLGEERFVHSTGKAGSDGVVINSLDPAAPDYREDLATGILQMGSIF